MQVQNASTKMRECSVFYFKQTFIFGFHLSVINLASVTYMGDTLYLYFFRCVETVVNVHMNYDLCGTDGIAIVL